MSRFIVLEHTGAPDDPAGRHYDLLLEDGPACRTWRLEALPQPGGAPVTAVELPAHRLAWLDHESGEISGGRGVARRVDAGTFEPRVSGATGTTTLEVTLRGVLLEGLLLLRAGPDGWRVGLAPGSGEQPPELT